MGLIGDFVVQMLFCLLVFCILLTVFPRRRRGVWLVLLVVLLFGLPRAGMIINSINLPLPIAHILAVFLIVEWAMLYRTKRSARSRLSYFFLIYAAVAALGLAVGLSTGGNKLIAIIESFFYLFSIGLFFYASSYFDDRASFVLFGKTLLVISVFVSLYGISQRYLGSQILLDQITYNSASSVAQSYLDPSEPGFRRVLSSYGDPNVLAGQLVIFSAIALAIILGHNVSVRARMICMPILALNVFCIVCTGSRMALVSLAVVTTIIFAWQNRWLWLAFAVVIFVAIITGPQLATTAIANRLGGFVGESDIRLQFPVIAWELLRAAPFGCGFGNTIEFAINNFDWSFDIGPANVVWAGLNSFWLTLFSRLGIPGLLGFLLLVTALAHYVWHQARHVEHPQAQAFLIGALAGLIGQWIIWMANNTYMLPGGGLNFWFTIGMLVAGCRAFVSQPYPTLIPVSDDLTIPQTLMA